jgi:hypothetical protein
LSSANGFALYRCVFGPGIDTKRYKKPLQRHSPDTKAGLNANHIPIPSPISMGDLGFGRHPARLAVAWHPADSTMAKA